MRLDFIAVFAPLLAAGWEDFLRLLPIVVAVLAWVISHFAGQAVKRPPPQRARPVQKPGAAPPPVKPANDPLQSEIDQFLRQAQAAREGKEKPTSRPVPAGRQPQRGARRPIAAGPKRDPQRPGPQPSEPPIVVEVAPSEVQRGRPHESVAQHVAQTLDSSKFDQRATQFSQMQQQSDTEFQQHMQRVFHRDIGSLKSEAAGIFEAAGATASAAAAASVAKANVAAAGAESGTAPVATQKRTSDIALFLAGRKNIRDAIILSEILNRPEHRW